MIAPAIGTLGKPWTQTERDVWREQQRARRSYRDLVLARLNDRDQAFALHVYGELAIDPARYPLVAVVSAAPREGLPWALVTGGVHGYETSGVTGALDFLLTRAPELCTKLNLVVVPCVSPWSFEVIQRWNPNAVDPNRSFLPGGEAEEARALIRLVAGLGHRFLVHVDLHETTDSDESEFRPALAARDGKPFVPGHVPDGFYLVADADAPEPAFQAAIIRAVSQISHIAPPDPEGRIIGEPVTQPGVIHYPFRALGLAAGMTDARFRTTTEVYPDSPRATDDICRAAQVAAVEAAIRYALGEHDPGAHAH